MGTNNPTRLGAAKTISLDELLQAVYQKASCEEPPGETAINQRLRYWTRYPKLGKSFDLGDNSHINKCYNDKY